MTVNDTASTTLDNRLPSVGAVTITPNPASISDVLTCTASSVVDPDGGSVNLSYEWELGGSVVGTATTLTYAFTRGDVVTCTVTPMTPMGRSGGKVLQLLLV